jgi:hypothetical protein
MSAYCLKLEREREAEAGKDRPRLKDKDMLIDIEKNLYIDKGQTKTKSERGKWWDQC